MLAAEMQTQGIRGLIPGRATRERMGHVNTAVRRRLWWRHASVILFYFASDPLALALGRVAAEVRLSVRGSSRWIDPRVVHAWRLKWTIAEYFG